MLCIEKVMLSLMHQGKPRFLCLDQGSTLGLPVVAMRLNPECHLNYNDIDLQNILSKPLVCEWLPNAV